MTAGVGVARAFGERVVAAVGSSGPLCVGIDPSAALLGEWGLPDDAGGLRTFGLRCIEAFAGVVPVVKPQVAFFERHGAAGFSVLEHVLKEARQAGLVVIADAKRGDIGSTSAAYAAAWLGDSSPLAADALTAVAYLGMGTLVPLVEAARRSGRGVFVVVQSSNPEGRQVQDALTDGGRSVADSLLAEIAEMNAGSAVVGAEGSVAGGPVGPPGPVGAVIGATVGRAVATLVQFGGIVLAPGVGAQGASASDVAALFGGCPTGTVLPSVSRSVLGAGPDVAALRRAAALVRDEMAEVLM
ncbi:MAG: orotidine-5'-phosphate decarboxylase [Acidimicrobiales bacterium]